MSQQMLPPVVGRIVGDNSSFVRSLDDSERHVRGSTDRSGRHFSKLGGVMGTVMIAGAAAATLAVGGFAIKSISAASDLAETASKVGVVFGEQQGIVTSFANDMADKFGLPKTAILEAASSIGLIGKAAGLSQGDAAGMSTQLAKMAADASSFYNVPLPEALQAIQSGLVGEAEPMRRFGVLLNEDAVKAEALALGIATTTDELTEGQKVQARSSLIMKGMTDASGDLERTQGSLANRIREVKGRAENMAASVGTVLLPAVLKLFDWSEQLGEKLGTAFESVTQGWQWLVAGFSDPAAAQGPDHFLDVIFNLGAGARVAFDAIRSAVGPVTEFIRNNTTPVLVGLGVVVGVVLLGAVWGLVAAIGAVLSPVVLVVAGIAALAAGVVYAYQHFAAFRGVVDQLWQTMQSGFVLIQGVVTVAVAVITDLWNRFGGQLVGHIQTHLAAVLQVFSGVLQVVQGVFNVFAGIFTGDWSRVWEGIKGILDGILNIIVGLVRWAVNIISTIIGAGMAAISSLWSAAWHGLHTLLSDAFGGIHSAISSGIDTAVSFVASLPGRARDALGNLGGLLFGAGQDLIMGFVNGVGSMARALADKALSVVRGAVDAVKGFLHLDSPSRLFFDIGVNVGEGFALGMLNQRGAVAAAAASMASSAASAIDPLTAGWFRPQTVAQMMQSASDSYTALVAQGGRPLVSRDQFVRNSQSDPDRFREGYVNMEDGGWGTAAEARLGTAGATGRTTTINYSPVVHLSSQTGEVSPEGARRIRDALILYGRDLPGDVHLG